MCKIFVLKYFRGLWQPMIIKHTKRMLYTNIRAFNFRGRLPHENILTRNIFQKTVHVFISLVWPGKRLFAKMEQVLLVLVLNL